MRVSRYRPSFPNSFDALTPRTLLNAPRVFWLGWLVNPVSRRRIVLGAMSASAASAPMRKLLAGHER